MFIQAQSVDGAFLASATRCPTSRLAERLAEKRKAAMSANKHSTAKCAPTGSRGKQTRKANKGEHMLPAF